jgi:uncharacterized protein YjcR
MPFEKKWDWEAIRLDYMVGEILTNKDGIECHRPYTLKRLAEKYNMSLHTMQEKSKREKWTHQRNLLDSKLRRRMTEGKVTSILGESNMSDTLALAQLGKTAQLINAYFNQYPQAFKSASEDGCYEEEMPQINPKDLKDIVEVIGKVHTLTKAIMGTESLQEHLEELQTKEKTKQLSKLKGNPNEMNDRIKKLLEERQRIEANLKQEKRAVEDINVINAKTITEIESY